MSQGLKTPNGYFRGTIADGASDTYVAIPARTRLIEVWGRTLDVVVGLNAATTAMLDSSPETVGTVAFAGNTEPVQLVVNPDDNYAAYDGANSFAGRRFTYLHYKAATTGSASTIVVNFYR